jgi:hypothetical protein
LKNDSFIRSSVGLTGAPFRLESRVPLAVPEITRIEKHSPTPAAHPGIQLDRITI